VGLEPFDIGAGAQRVADAGEDAVGRAFARAFDHDVAGIVDDIEIVAAEPGHGVGAGLAVERVGAGIAAQAIGHVVAGEVDRRGAGIVGGGQQFGIDARRLGVADAGEDAVGAAFGGALDHLVGDIVDIIPVVAAGAVEGVGAGLAVEHVRSGIADDV